MIMPATANSRELLIGAGSSRVKKLFKDGRNQWGNLVTLDINADHQPDIVWNLEDLPLPFANDEFDEIHAYEVLEHTGQQGDYVFFFAPARRAIPPGHGAIRHTNASCSRKTLFFSISANT
jgi:hypothetical protein